MKSDFSEFPLGVGEGQHGRYWYHEDSQAYFDDVDHYRMIRAMCKLSCSICDINIADQRRDGSSRRNKFKNIEQLKGHLYHQHKMFMCSLCLEGRKVFISEQKLYNRSQLRQHTSSGDSEVDGSEIERGGFIGHPLCDFCKVPFYGDNELYMHMSTEHYTCHICQRQHPGQYVYYGNYDDLEIHFRHEHFLCEDESCLTKKFVVFQSEAEMKRHNALEHGGHMSRSKRNAALQLPVSFRYRQSTEYDQRRGRGRGFRREPNQLTIQAHIEMAIAEGESLESYSGFARPNVEHGETNQPDSLISSMESLAISSHPEELSSRSDAINSQSFGSVPIVEEISFPPLSNYELPETSSRYAQALNQGSSARLGEASFPPLPGAKDIVKPKIPPVSEGLGGNTIAARLNLQNKRSVKVLHSARPKVPQIYEPSSSNSVNSLEMRPSTQSHGTATSSLNPLPWGTANLLNPPLSSSSHAPSVRGNEFATSIPIRSAWNSNKMNRVRHSSSAPNLSNSDNSNNHPSNMNMLLPISVEPIQQMENLQTANKSLVQSIFAGLGMDEEKYTTFKTISTEYRQGEINTLEYLSYVEQFGLSHLVLELARMCPDTLKRKELIDAYNANLCNNEVQESNKGKAVSTNKNGKKGKGKGKTVDHAENTTAKDALADSILDQVRKLQTNHLPCKDDLEVLSKDGYRTSKDQVPFSTKDRNTPATVIADDSSSENKIDTNKNSGGETSKKNRKTKIRNTDSNIERNSREQRSNHADGVPVRGVWSNGGGQRLFSHSGSSK